MKYLAVLTMALVLSGNASAKPTKKQREAIIFTVTVTSIAATMNPAFAVAAIITADKITKMDISAGKRYKRHTRSGR